jgi:hypothetical protein
MEGLSFFQSFLEGGSYLARAASKLVEPGDDIVTWLPENVDLQDVSLAEGWNRHGIPNLEDLWRPLEDITHRFLNESPHHVALVEAAYNHPLAGVPELIQSCSKFAEFSYFSCESIVGDETSGTLQNKQAVDVFGYLTGCGQSSETVSEFIEQAFPYHQIIALISNTTAPIVKSGSQVDKSYPAQLAHFAHYLAIGAYDGSGVLLWTRSGLRAH